MLTPVERMGCAMGRFPVPKRSEPSSMKQDRGADAVLMIQLWTLDRQHAAEPSSAVKTGGGVVIHKDTTEAAVPEDSST